MRIILAAFLTAAIAAPAAAHTAKMSETARVKKAHAAMASVHHPATVQTKDVYVDGRYVGSDPDWFVRESLRREAIGHDKL